MEKKIRNLLIGFIVVMLLLTIISRGAASAMVAKVQVDTFEKGTLKYEVTGTGIIKANASKYIELMSGFRINEVMIEKGGSVKEGDILFSYDLRELKKKKSELANNLQKLELQYKKIGLAGLAVPAEEEEKSILLAIEEAKENIKTAKINLSDTKRTVKENNEKEYTKAVKDLEELVLSREEELKRAKRLVSDAENELSILEEPKNSLKEVIDNYKLAVTINNEEHQIQDACQAVMEFYYSDQLKKHLDEVSDAAKLMAREMADLDSIKKKWENIIINEWDKYGSLDIQNAYYEKLQMKQNEINNAERRVQDAKESYDKLTEVDNKLNEALNNYRTDLEHAADTTSTYQHLYQILSDGKLAEKTTLTEAETRLLRAREDLEELNNSWDRKLKAAEENKEKLYKTFVSLKDGSYDFTEDIKDAGKAVEDAQRAYERAVLQLEQLKLQEKATEESKRGEEASKNIERDILEIDINNSKEEIKLVDNIILDHGEIHSPVEGVVSENNLQQGSLLSGQEKLVITTGGYELVMTADKEEISYFEIGDEVSFKTPLASAYASTQLENIDLPDENGKVTFTALLPEGEYQAGASLEYKLNKESDTYLMCLPIQSLRQDMGGTFILIAKDKDSVLGKVKEAFRVTVTVLSKDSKTAAVEGAITEKDEIIVGSNRNFSEGDRVRIYDME